MQPFGDITFDHVITWQVKNIISQLLQMLQSPNLVGTHMRTKWYHCYMSRDFIYSFIIFLNVIHIFGASCNQEIAGI